MKTSEENIKEFEELLKNGWKELLIKNQVSNDDFTLLRKASIRINAYQYKHLVKCNKCGYIFIIGKLHNLKNCPACKYDESINKYNGTTVNNYKIIKFDHYGSNGYTKFYQVECLNCGSKSIISQNSIFHPVNGNYCKKCVYKNRVGKVETPLHAYYLQYKRAAKARNLEFGLSEEKFRDIIDQPCFYCGQDPTYGEYVNKNFNKSGILVKYNGVDRIDSFKGYSADNCVSCCTMCNRMKLDYKKLDFLQKIIEIYNHLNLDKGLTTIENSLNNESELSTLQANGNGNGEHLTE